MGMCVCVCVKIKFIHTYIPRNMYVLNIKQCLEPNSCSKFHLLSSSFLFISFSFAFTPRGQLDIKDS